MLYRKSRLDSNFWFFNFNFIDHLPFTGRQMADGFHLSGRMTYDGGSLIKRNFGIAVRYELHENRIRPFIFRFSSSPVIEITGRIIGSTTDGGIFSGDQWSKCWMHSRQTLYQLVFAPPGTNNRRIIAENRQVKELIFLEGSNKYKEFIFPGSLKMPTVSFSRRSLLPGLSIWAELEILFHVQLEGGSTLWLNPDIVIRMNQWELTPFILPFPGRY